MRIKTEEKKKRHALFLIMTFAVCAAYGQTAQVYCPDNGDGTYSNPIINADYSDPDVCVVGDDYYLTASSFQCIPGLPILHSRDLVNWTLIGHAVRALVPASDFEKPGHGNGVWAPSIRYHDGEFYIYWGDPDHGVFMVKAKASTPEELAAASWSDPLLVIEGKGMEDTCPLWDDDGRCYLVNGWVNSRISFNSQLSVRELSPDGTRAIGDPVMAYDGTRDGNYTVEGPKFYKRGGYYYIFAPAGGVENGWQLAMRSKSPYGPYEWKKVLVESKDVNGPHQGGWVHTPQGEDWFIHFQDRGAYGRVVWLEPVEWKDGWPLMGKKGQPVKTYNIPKHKGSVVPCSGNTGGVDDEFDSPTLSPQWQWHANYKQEYGMPTPDGFFRLFSNTLDGNLWHAPNLLLQKVPANDFTATAKVCLGARADGQWGGLVMMGRDYSALVVEKAGDSFRLELRSCADADKDKEETVTIVKTLNPTDKDKMDRHQAIYMDIYLRLTVVSQGKSIAPTGATVQYAYSLNGKDYIPCGSPFRMREGRWIGAKMGFVCEEAPAGKRDKANLDIDWFRLSR